MKILILGHSGMLGQSLNRFFLGQGLDVFTASRQNADIHFDACNPQASLKVLTHLKPRVLINGIALTSLEQCQKEPQLAQTVNADLVGFLANFSQTEGCKLVQISTDHYYQGQGSAKQSEEAPIELLNEYAKSKRQGELYALKDPNSLVIRTNIVGFRGQKDNPTFVEWAIKALAAEEPLTLFDDYFTSSIACSQLAESLLELINKDCQGIINLASNQVSSKKQFIEALAKRFDLPLKNSSVQSLHSHSQIPRADSCGLDVSKAEQVLGCSLPNLEQVIENLWEEFQNLLKS